MALTAWSVAVVATVLLLSARPALDEGFWFFAVDVTVAAVYGTVAAVVLARRRHPVPWVLAVTAVGGAVAAFGFAWTLLAQRRPLPWVDVIGPLQGIAWVPGTLALFCVVPWLVRDHPLGRARWGVALGSAVAVAFTASQALQLGLAVWAMSAAAVVVGLVAAADATRRWARGPVDERIGLGWLAVGTTVMAVSFLPLAVPPLWDVLPIWFTPVLHLAAQAVYPAAVLVAVLRQRMWGLDLAVSRAVVAGVLSVGLLALYVAVATGAAAVLPGDGFGQLVAAAVVAVAVQPTRLWVQRRVHRLVHGEGSEPDRVVRRLGQQLGSARTTDELLGGLASGVASALRLESATVVVDDVAVASSGSPTSVPVQVPLVHRGARVGTLDVTAPPGEWLGARAVRTLEELAVVVAAGVALARAAVDLEDARARLTSARLEERRVIRRELHDGLGPSLAGLRLGLQGARNLVERDPGSAVDLLAALQAELDQRVDDVRTLSRHLLPPVLDELGLGPALEELAARHEGTGLVVGVHCDVPEVRPALAAAAYGIAAEAVTNVVRHAGASRCTVDVAVDGTELVLVVEDDGVGIAPGARPGVGSRSMRERAAEQGGSVEVTAAAAGGTRVEARMRLGSAG
ncbi:sensor histidine kinase [Thalassiella azotivora]